MKEIGRRARRMEEIGVELVRLPRSIGSLWTRRPLRHPQVARRFIANVKLNTFREEKETNASWWVHGKEVGVEGQVLVIEEGDQT